ncbi:acyltransferase [Conexibacter woesei]|uniref:acyltransferase n=1 Tax=Conexibacter woesei TaxID=191495 RepID=UPI00041FE111|nr:acyltransferase [Conexibacter woesei]
MLGIDGERLLLQARILKYRRLSTCPHVSGPDPVVVQPVLFLGPGRIALGRDVEFGWKTSRGFHTGYCHVEAATPEASIRIGDGVQLNNDIMLKSEGPGIVIGDRTLIGSQVTIYDSDFHELHPDRRRGGTPSMGQVVLGENVFVGDGATILKGVEIGRDSVVGAGSVVTASIPPGVIAAGNPARVVRPLAP